MKHERLIDSLASFLDVLPAAVAGLRPEDARWRPPDNAWSVLEVVRHLADEEDADFPVRLRSTLEDPGRQWAPIDPEGWARDRDYNAGDLEDAVALFLERRRASLAWIRDVVVPDWSVTHRHPKFSLEAGDLLASWAAHDMLHLRQIAKRRYQMILRDADGFSAGYAGPW